MQRNSGNICPIPRLWLSADPSDTPAKGLSSQWQESPPDNARTQPKGGLSKAQDVSRASNRETIPISIEGLTDSCLESGLASRHYVPTHTRGLCVLNRLDRCAQSLYCRCWAEQHALHIRLSTSGRIGPRCPRSSRHYQQRPGESVYEPLMVRVYRVARHTDQHDGSRSLSRQCVYRTAVAHAKKRRQSSAWLGRSLLDTECIAYLGSVVQRATSPSESELSVSKGSIYKQREEKFTKRNVRKV